jgi:hypothetical protein
MISISSRFAKQALPLQRTFAATVSTRTFSDSGGSITYSGGHASNGQGGYYGSGGSRAGLTPNAIQRPDALAGIADIKTLSEVVGEISSLENLIRKEEEMLAKDGKNSPSSALIGLKSKLKKYVTRPALLDALQRLEFKGQPVWGLSVKEREVVEFFRQKVNDV